MNRSEGMIDATYLNDDGSQSMVTFNEDHTTLVLYDVTTYAESTQMALYSVENVDSLCAHLASDSFPLNVIDHVMIPIDSTEEQ